VPLIAWFLKAAVADNKNVHKEPGKRIGKVDSDLAKVREVRRTYRGHLYRPSVAAGPIPPPTELRERSTAASDGCSRPV